jgi:hypothetical protein
MLRGIRMHLLDRVSSCIQSPRTLSSRRLFFSWIRPGSVADLLDEDKPFELERRRRSAMWSVSQEKDLLIVITECSSMWIVRMGIGMRDFEGSGFLEIFRSSFVVRIIMIGTLLFGLDGKRLLEILIFDECLQLFHVPDRREIVLDAFNRFEEF